MSNASPPHSPATKGEGKMSKCTHPVSEEWFMWDRLCGVCMNPIETHVISNTGTGDFDVPRRPFETGSSNRTLFIKTEMP